MTTIFFSKIIWICLSC